MIKRKYMMIIALAIVSVLVGSLFYSNVTFGASGSSGSWGAIRFEETTEVEVPVYPDNVTVAQFDWYPQNSSNNALLPTIQLYCQYCKKTGDFAEIVLVTKLYDYDGNLCWYDDRSCECYEEWRWRTIGVMMPGETGDLPINQVRYRFIVEASALSHTAYVRNLNIIILVADGMVPNEYYKVGLPSGGVGGLWIPVDKLSLLAPYVALVSTIILAVSISVAIIRYRKKQ